MGGAVKRTTFHLVLIKPTHYDDDGYPITWFRSHIPSNTLACALWAGRRTAAAARCLGPNVDIDIKPLRRDQPPRPPGPDHCRHQRTGGKALICLVGVQSNQFPRAVDLATPLPQGRPAGGDGRLPCFRLPRRCCRSAARDPGGHGHGHLDLRRRGRGGRLDDVLLDAWNGTLKPLYNYMDDLPGIEGRPPAVAAGGAGSRNEGRKSSFDLGRGCPFQCSFCTIINVQGRKSRIRNRRRSRSDRARELSRASSRSSSPTTISPATRIGKTSSTA
jgi:hypothetical protein